MSYAQYLFLVEVDEPVDRITDDGLKEIVQDEYEEYMEKYHANEHGYLLTIATETNHQVNFLQEGYQWSRPDPYEAAIRFAVMRVIRESQAFDTQLWEIGEPTPAEKEIDARLDALLTDQLLSDCQQWLARDLAKQYRRMKPVELSHYDTLKEYRTRRRAEMLHKLRHSYGDPIYRLPPFDDACSPYDYPAMQLTHKGRREDGRPNRLIFVASLHS